MDLSDEVSSIMRQFVSRSRFAEAGGVITDLDGTALHEHEGRIYIPPPVELGFKELHDLGRPFVLNTLRFPLSVLRTFGREWYNISNAPIPAVTLNGSLLGYVTKTDEDEMVFEEMAAFPLESGQIDHVMNGVDELVSAGIKNLLLFYYPRDWRVGEVIWTPVPEKVIEVKERYRSASSVTAVEAPKLRDQLHAEDICMIFVLVQAEEEQLMAYQHTKRNNFFTAQGVDKLFGAQRAAEIVGFDLEHSLGAGDTELDRFLNGVGLAVLVGGLTLAHQGRQHTVRLRDSFELGEFLFQMAGMLRGELSAAEAPSTRAPERA